MREYKYEVWTTNGGEHRPVRMVTASDPDPLVAFQEALAVAEKLADYDIVEYTVKTVASKEYNESS
jgi:hypothetical protein